jgi:hypothetical protein
MKNDYEVLEESIKDDLEKVVGEYFKQFLNKFDNFNNQMKIADILLKVYQIRYEKLKNKYSNVNDIISGNYDDYKDFVKQVDKLDQIESKLTNVEIKLHNLNTA